MWRSLDAQGVRGTESIHRTWDWGSSWFQSCTVVHVCVYNKSVIGSEQRTVKLGIILLMVRTDFKASHSKTAKLLSTTSWVLSP